MMFLFPCLKIKDELVRQFSEFGFVNSYLFWMEGEYDFNTLYLVFRPSEFSLGFHLLISALEKNINFIETVDRPGAVILVYKVPSKFGSDYLLVLNGAYSLTSPDFKGCFQMRDYKIDEKGNLMKTPSGSYITEHSTYYHVFNKTEYLRAKWIETLGEGTRLPKDMELYEKCDINKETLVV